MTRLFYLGAPSLTSLLAEPTAAALRKAATPVTYPDKTLIYSRGELRPGLSMVHEGAVQIGNPGIDGSFVVTSVLGSGHCFGEMTLFGKLPRTHDSVAVGDTILDQITPAAYQEVSAAHPELTEAILGMMARRLHALLEFTDDLRRLPLNVQLAKTLMTMASRQRLDSRVEANQEELAAILGVSRVAIGTVLSRLERDGLVKRRYGRVEIPDRAKLKEWVSRRTMLAPIEAGIEVEE